LSRGTKFRTKMGRGYERQSFERLSGISKHSNFSTLWACSLIVHHRLASPGRAPCRFEDPTHWTAHWLGVSSNYQHLRKQILGIQEKDIAVENALFKKGSSVIVTPYMISDKDGTRRWDEFLKELSRILKIFYILDSRKLACSQIMLWRGGTLLLSRCTNFWTKMGRGDETKFWRNWIKCQRYSTLTSCLACKLLHQRAEFSHCHAVQNFGRRWDEEMRRSFEETEWNLRNGVWERTQFTTRRPSEDKGPIQVCSSKLTPPIGLR